MGKLGYKGFIFLEFFRNFRAGGEDSLFFEVEFFVFDVTEGFIIYIIDMFWFFMD